MAQISPRISESLDEYIVLDGWIKARPEQVSMQTQLGTRDGPTIFLQYPYATARMQSVTGPNMVVTGGKLGILTMVARNLPQKYQQSIVDANNAARKLEGEIEFLDKPEFAHPTDTLEDVLKQIHRLGHSIIPIMDRFSKLHGIYIHDPENLPVVPPHTAITEVMHTLTQRQSVRKRDGAVFYLNKDLNESTLKRILSHQERRFVPILDKNGVLQKIAFLNKFNTNYIGIAVRTKGKWQEDIERWGPQVDTMCIDTSNACFDDAIKIMKYAQSKFPTKPFGIGNIIRGVHFEVFAKEGADYIIAGKATGSICVTGSRRANGRASFTTAREMAETRDMIAKSGRYVPFFLDGGIEDVYDMIVALAFADGLMMGRYFVQSLESAARKFNAAGKPTQIEAEMVEVETWGEGSEKAKLVGKYGVNYEENPAYTHALKRKGRVERYGNLTQAGATTEGVSGRVPYRGRLKTYLESEAPYIKATMANAGAVDLASYRECAVVEKLSERAQEEMKPHGITVTKE